MKTKRLLGLVLLLVVLMTACSKDDVINDVDNNKWNEIIGGTIDAKQNWITSVVVKLNIEAESGSTVTAYAINSETPIILGEKEMKGNGVMTVEIPQGVGESFGLKYTTQNSVEYKRIYLSGEKMQKVDVCFSSAYTKSILSRATESRATGHNPELDGNSLTGQTGYSSFGGWAWENLAAALPEGQNVGNNPDINHDYEIESFGPMYVSFLYGYTGNYGKRVLGYYHHSPGDFSDIVFVDITEALYYDYLNGQAKVQYQINGDESTWLDANFDYRDGDGLPTGAVTTRYTARQGDDAYNTLLVHNAYKDKVSAMRGLSFKVDVPEGEMIGFYLKLPEIKLGEEQMNYLRQAGIPEDKFPECETNFSKMELNTNSSRGQYRSAMRSYGNFTFMGMDDSNYQGDMDCNDVTFGLLDQYGQPYSNPPKTVQSWTIGFEDMGTEQDFDFNDVVIQVTPNTYEHTIDVKLLAAGGTLKTEIYYCDEKLCEVHEAFNVSQTTMVNTDETATIAPVTVATGLSWPDGYTITENGNLFKIKVYRADGSEVFVSIDSYLNSKTPQAVCIAGDWAWPKEKISISSAYELIGKWGQNVTDKDFWNWYASPTVGNVVTPYSGE